MQKESTNNSENAEPENDNSQVSKGEDAEGVEDDVMNIDTDADNTTAAKERHEKHNGMAKFVGHYSRLFNPMPIHGM